jgi:hypothetical protein
LANADTEVKTRIVVPEFSALITFSGASNSSRPVTLTVEFERLIDAPSALQPAIVARVSLERRELAIVEFPGDSDAIATALWV